MFQLLRTASYSEKVTKSISLRNVWNCYLSCVLNFQQGEVLTSWSQDKADSFSAVGLFANHPRDSTVDPFVIKQSDDM